MHIRTNTIRKASNLPSARSLMRIFYRYNLEFKTILKHNKHSKLINLLRYSNHRYSSIRSNWTNKKSQKIKLLVNMSNQITLHRRIRRPITVMTLIDFKASETPHLKRGKCWGLLHRQVKLHYRRPLLSLRCNQVRDQKQSKKKQENPHRIKLLKTI